MISPTEIFFLMGLGFSLAAPLGPVNMEMIKRALSSRFGFMLGIVTGVGAMIGDFIVAFTILFIGDEYLRGIIEIPSVYVILLVFNVGFLSYIGLSALRSKQEDIEVITEDQLVVENTKLSRGFPVIRQLLTGFIIVVTSPWSYFWWTSFGGFIINSGLPLGTSVERFVVTMYFLAGIFTWVLLFCGILGISQRLASPRILNIITKSSALIIVGFAIGILYNGIVYIGSNFV